MTGSIPDSFEQLFSYSGSEQKVEVIYGPMFSGKTEELIRRLREAERTGEQVQAFKPEIDTRHGKGGQIISHGNETYNANSVTDAESILSVWSSTASTVGIDEAQFFDESIISVTTRLVESNCRVIVAGLDLDFRGEPFGSILRLAEVADKSQKLFARCAICGTNADRTQRLVNGKPAHFSDPLVVVGGNETYEPRCRAHHTVRE